MTQQMTAANKKVVHYVGKPIFYGELEHGAQIYPVDHPDRARVTNYKVAWTSSVLSYDPISGRMETLNTVYMPLGSGEGPSDVAKEVTCTCGGFEDGWHSKTCQKRL